MEYEIANVDRCQIRQALNVRPQKERPGLGERRLNETLRSSGPQYSACISSCPLDQGPGLGRQQSGQNL